MYLPFDSLYILEFFQCLYAFFVKLNKIFMGLNVFFLRFTAAKCYYVFSMKNLYLLTAKNTPDVNNPL